jgi:hypothetical protein
MTTEHLAKTTASFKHFKKTCCNLCNNKPTDMLRSDFCEGLTAGDGKCSVARLVQMTREILRFHSINCALKTFTPHVDNLAIIFLEGGRVKVISIYELPPITLSVSHWFNFLFLMSCFSFSYPLV